MNKPEEKPLSASELNKYAYCPYQWYYERIYGRKELRRLYQERNERLGLTDGQTGNFARGLHYHEKSYRRLIRRGRLRKLAAFLLMVGAAYLWVRYGMA